MLCMQCMMVLFSFLFFFCLHYQVLASTSDQNIRLGFHEGKKDSCVCKRQVTWDIEIKLKSSAKGRETSYQRQST